MTKTIEVGTISHGTLNPYDLVIRFKTVLKAVWPEKHKEITAMQNDIEIYDLLEECIRALDEYGAQYGLYFGAHEGDGADFGFWPIDSRDEEEHWWATHCSCGAEKGKEEPWLCTSCPPEE